MNSKRTSNVGLKDFLYRRAGGMGIPLSGTFELSPVCNFSCRMCYVRKTQKEVDESPRKILTLDDWRSLAAQAREAGMLYLLLTGGEPLLWPDFWTLYDELIDMGFLISINTNGSLIDDRAVAHFRKKPPVRINITLYGAGEDSYRDLCGNGSAFRSVDRAIRNLRQADVPVKLNCSLTPRNAQDLEWVVAYARELDVQLDVATYMFPPIRRDPEKTGENERFSPEACAQYMIRYMELSRSPRAYRAFLDAVAAGCADPQGLDENCVDPLDGKVRCRAGKSSFWISWDGKMMPCGMTPEPAVDLKERAFPEAWERLKAITAKIRLSGICSKCPNMDGCHPCLAIAQAETGTSEGIPEYRCRATRELYRLACEKKDEIINKNLGGNDDEHA